MQCFMHISLFVVPLIDEVNAVFCLHLLTEDFYSVNLVATYTDFLKYLTAL
jgi:hypothetical protein